MSSENSANETLLNEFEEKVSSDENGMHEVLSPSMAFVPNAKNRKLVKKMNNSDPFPKTSSQLQDLQANKLPLCGLHTSAKSNKNLSGRQSSFKNIIKKSQCQVPEFRCKIKSESEVVYSRNFDSNFKEISKDSVDFSYKENGEYKFKSAEGADAYSSKLPLSTLPLKCSTPLGPSFFCSPISIRVNPQTCIEVLGSGVASPAVGSFISYGPICRICHDGDEKEKFISPCLCSGSLALVHKSCLEKWLSTSNEGKCELCNFIFPVERKPKSFSQFLCERSNSFERRAILSDFAGLCILTPLILATTFLCITGALNLSNNEGKPHPFKWPYSRGDNVSYFYNGSYRNHLLNKTLLEHEAKNSTVSKGPFSGLVVLSVVLLAIYFAWVTVAIKYHRRAWQVWRASNQQILLTDAQQRSP